MLFFADRCVRMEKARCDECVSLLMDALDGVRWLTTMNGSLNLMTTALVS